MAQKSGAGNTQNVRAGTLTVSLDKAVSTLRGMFPAFTDLHARAIIQMSGSRLHLSTSPDTESIELIAYI